MDENSRFCSTTDASWDAVWAVARFLHNKRDREIWIEAKRNRPDFEHRNGYGDKCDMYMRFVGTERWHKYEIKGRDLIFDAPENYPFPTIFIDRRRKIDDSIADGYFIVNQALTHFAYIDKKTRPYWLGPHEYMDSKKGYPFWVYEAPVAVGLFYPLLED